MKQHTLEMPHVFMSFKNVTSVLERADSENQIGLYLNPSCDGYQLSGLRKFTFIF